MSCFCVFVWPGHLAKPCAVLVVEQRSQLVVHPAVVTVEPFDFLRVEQGPVYRFHVDGTEGERVELEECAELGFPIGQDDLRVFDAYAMPPFLVDARFVGSRSCRGGAGTAYSSCGFDEDLRARTGRNLRHAPCREDN